MNVSVWTVLKADLLYTLLSFGPLLLFTLWKLRRAKKPNKPAVISHRRAMFGTAEEHWRFWTMRRMSARRDR